MSDYSINDRVSVEIHGTSPVGLMGRVVNGPRAIIRRREIAWKQPGSLDSYLQQTLPAVVLGYDLARGQLELSLRLVERDPWVDADARYSVGREVEGRVVGLIEHAAFVELEPGVDAYLPLAGLPIAPDQRIENWLWLNDMVRASVEEVNAPARRLKINMHPILTRREKRIHRLLWASDGKTGGRGVTVAEVLPQDTRLKLLRIHEEPHTRRARPLRVLLIEDDEAFSIGLQSLLRSNGCQVASAEDGEKGLAQLKKQEKPHDLVICDWNLPGLKGYDLLRQMQRQGCPSRMIMILDPVFLHQSPEAEAVLQQTDFEILTKVNVYQLKVSLLAILRELREVDHNLETHKQPTHLEAPAAIASTASPAAIEEDGPTAQSYQERLQHLLDRVRLETGAVTAALVRLDPGRSLPVTEGCSGEEFPLEKAQPDIMYSPLEDVLVKKQETRVEASPHSSRLEKLLTLAEFHEFLGLPLPMLEAAAYGLILLKEEAGFTASQRDQARLIASLLARIVQERRMIQIFQPWQAQNLVGQISSSIIHEVDNKLGGIELLVDALQEGLKQISRHPEKAGSVTLLRELEKAVEGIANAQHSASELRNWYLGLTATDELQAVDLKTIAQDMLRALKSQAQENNILLGFKAPRRPFTVIAKPGQLRQVFMNLILNAIQQMAELHRSGSLQIELSWVEGATLPIQVRFTDQGPGIHRTLQDQVFDFGFTTRRNGAGLGLTISRHIVTSLKGRLLVETSHIFWGTTFLLELPMGE